MNKILKQINWGNISKLGKNKYVKSSYFWIAIVPIIAKFFYHTEKILTLNVFNQNIVIDLALPFSWKVFFIAALLFTIGNLFYMFRCPKILQENNNANDFFSIGKGEEHLKNYAEEIGLSIEEPRRGIPDWLLTKMLSKEEYERMNRPSIIGTSSMSELEAIRERQLHKFWTIFEAAKYKNIISIYVSIISYALGLLLILWLILANIAFVLLNWGTLG